MKIDIKGDIIFNDDKWIYDWMEMDGVCPRDVHDLIEKANGEPLEVFVNSGGGSVIAGDEIFDAFQRYAGQVNFHVVYAASAASLIVMAGHSDITPVGKMMIHNVAVSAQGDYHDMDDTSEFLQKADRALAQAYMQKTGKSEKEILSLMDKESWFTAQEAVDAGLIDEIYQANATGLVASYNSVPRKLIEKIRNTVKNPFADAQNHTAKEWIEAQGKLKLLDLKERVIE